MFLYYGVLKNNTMNTTIKTTSEKQFKQIRRFVKKNNNFYTINNQHGFYSLTISGLTISESEKFVKNLIKTNHLVKMQQEPLALAA